MELPGVPDDTHPQVRRRQLEGLRAMTLSQKAEMTFALWANTDELAYAGMRLRHGDLPMAEMRRRLAVMRLGEDLVRRVEAYRARRDASSHDNAV